MFPVAVPIPFAVGEDCPKSLSLPMAMVLSLIIASPSALSKAAGHPLANKSITNVLVTGFIPLLAKPVESANASTVKPPYKPEFTAVA